MPLWYLLAWGYLLLSGGGLGLDIIVYLSPREFKLTIDIGPRTNTKVIVGQTGTEGNDQEIKL